MAQVSGKEQVRPRNDIINLYFRSSRYKRDLRSMSLRTAALVLWRRSNLQM